MRAPPGSRNATELICPAVPRIHTVHLGDVALGALFAFVVAAFVVWLAWGYVQKQTRKLHRLKAVDFAKSADVRIIKEILGDVNLPAWLRYPDNERVGWINSVIEQLWPYIEQTSSGLVFGKLNPLLKVSRPRWIADISIRYFKLGKVPPNVTSVKVFDTSCVVDEVVMELEVAWASQQRFQLELKPLPRVPLPLGLGLRISNFLAARVGVTDLFLAMRLRVAMKPLLDRIPIVGAIKVSIVEPPQLGYNLNVQGGDVTFLPGLEAYLNSFIRETLLMPYMLPDGFTIPLVDNLNSIDVPKGILFLRVIEARHVPRMDWFSSTDAYVEVYVSKQQRRRTKAIASEQHPRWDEPFELLVHDPERERLEAVLYNHDIMHRDEEIGRCKLPIKEMAAGEVQDMWLDLGPSESTTSVNPIHASIQGARALGGVLTSFFHKRRKKPQLHLEVAFYPVGADEVSAATQSVSTGQAEEQLMQRQQERDRERRDERLDDESSRAEVSGNHTEMQQGGQGNETEQQQENESEQRQGHEQRNEQEVRRQRLAERDARVMNMLRGGVLLVKVKKNVETSPANEYVRVRVNGLVRETAAMHGAKNSDYEEILEFALPGEVADDPSVQIEVEVYDYHWLVSLADEAMTWGSRVGAHEFPGQARLRIPLRRVIEARRLSDVFSFENLRGGSIELELQWIPILDRGSGPQRE